jgi:hypothetical protein
MAERLFVEFDCEASATCFASELMDAAATDIAEPQLLDGCRQIDPLSGCVAQIEQSWNKSRFQRLELTGPQICRHRVQP